MILIMTTEEEKMLKRYQIAFMITQDKNLNL